MSKGRVWITRSQPGAQKSAQNFKRAGFDTVIAPLIEIVPPDQQPKPPSPDAVLLFTSGNGVRAFAGLTELRRWPVLTVGDATADIARSAGFDTVGSADGAWMDLVGLVKETVSDERPLVHVCGALWRGPLVETLVEAGYRACRSIVYQTVSVDTVPIADLSGLTHIAFHSPRAAEILCSFSPDVGHLNAISISTAADQALGDTNFKNRLIADRSNEAAMIAALFA